MMASSLGYFNYYSLSIPNPVKATFVNRYVCSTFLSWALLFSTKQIFLKKKTDLGRAGLYFM